MGKQRLPALLIERVLLSVAVHPIASWNESFCRALDAEASSDQGSMEGSCRIKRQMALALHSKLVGKTDFPGTFSDGDICAIGCGVQRIRVWAGEGGSE